MTTELTPLKPEQIPVTWVPALTTELPFFYLTKNANHLRKRINIETVDSYGRPIRWKTTPNYHPDIGVPGIDAHEAWLRLLKPAFDKARQSAGSLPSIVPLGSVRECLRILGWGTGGWEAERLLRALRQIGATWCEADFWMPTIETDENGRPLFRPIKGQFSRLSLYAIGEKHVTDEELKSGKVTFDFDLSDVVYVQLHPLEVEMQRNQIERPIDNEYMFSVGPAARRWLELLQGKFFGVTKNVSEEGTKGPGYCEILYSWYVERHHTLKRWQERKRVVLQMNRLIKEHLAFGYVLKVEYFELRDGAGNVHDYRIRYYPGKGALRSTQRIASRRRSVKLTSDSPVQTALPFRLDQKVLSTAAHELVKEFHRAVSGVDDYLPGGKELSLAEDLINRYGPEKAGFIVSFSVTAAKETNFAMQNFCAVRQYVPKGSKRYEQARQGEAAAKKRQAQQLAQAEHEDEAEAETEKKLRALTADQYQALYKEVVQELVRQMPQLRDRIENPDTLWRDSIEAGMRKRLQ